MELQLLSLSLTWLELLLLIPTLLAFTALCNTWNQLYIIKLISVWGVGIVMAAGGEKRLRCVYVCVVFLMFPGCASASSLHLITKCFSLAELRTMQQLHPPGFDSNPGKAALRSCLILHAISYKTELITIYTAYNTVFTPTVWLSAVVSLIHHTDSKLKCHFILCYDMMNDSKSLSVLAVFW